MSLYIIKWGFAIQQSDYDGELAGSLQSVETLFAILTTKKTSKLKYVEISDSSSVIKRWPE